MQFEVLPQRKLLQKASIPIWLLPILLVAIVITLLQFAILIMADIQGRPVSGREYGGGGSVIGFAIVFGIYAWRLRRQQRHLQTALQALDLDRLTGNGEAGLYLYLRSFRQGRSTILRRLVPYAYGDQSLADASLGVSAFHLEEDMSNAIGHHGLLIAIGDRKDSYGAAKVITSDERWKEHFQKLATASRLIFIQPDVTQSVKWEVGQILGNPDWLAKTAWIMPRGKPDAWTTVAFDLRREIGLELAPHQPDGGLFRMSGSASRVVVMPSVFASILRQQLDLEKDTGQQPDLDKLWTEAAAATENLVANDKALRDMRRRARA